LPNERKDTAAAFLARAHAWYTAAGITIERVLSDNRACYRSALWAATCAQLGITPKHTRPYRPQTNGKVERFHRTLADEWAYARPYTSETERRAALTPGSTPTTITADTPHSKDSHPPAASPTCPGRMEAMRCLRRRLSDVVYRQLVADAQTQQAGPGGHSGATLLSSAAGLPPVTGTADQPLPGPLSATLPPPPEAKAAPTARSGATPRRRARGVNVERPGRTTLTPTSAGAHSESPGPPS
jgi:hypothetical protein